MNSPAILEGSPNPSNSSNSSLHPYMVYSGDPIDGAALVFARTAKHARRIGATVVQSWHDCEWIHIRAKRLRSHVEYLMSLATDTIPHVIESPPTCETCETWGAPLRGRGCERCDGEEA